MRLAAAAALLMVASALVSAYWALGGTGLLDTVGGSIARWGRQGGADVRALLVLIVVLKLVAAWLPVAATHDDRRTIRNLAWLEAAILTLYGGVLTAVGLAVQAGIISAGRDPDRRALEWHAFLWDPWFFVAGALTVGACLNTRARSARARHSGQTRI